jgi:uncharacterized protein YbjT (DUF2867 family)
MLLITGATGTVGTHVVRLLADKGQAVRAMTRNRARVPRLREVEVVQADFDDPASLRQAVAGVEAVFLLTAPESPTPRHDLAILDEARSAGINKIVKLSAIGTGTKIDANTTLGAWHLLAEQAVRASGMAWTILRPSTFASNFRRWADTINAGEPIPNLTGTGTQGVIDPRDVAAVAVETLISSVHIGHVYTLTGPELLSVPDQADRLEQALGRPVKTVDLPLDVARAQMLASGMDSSIVDVIITGSAWVRAGHNAILTDDVTRVLGRPPASFDAWARDHRDAFTNV